MAWHLLRVEDDLRQMAVISVENNHTRKKDWSGKFGALFPDSEIVPVVFARSGTVESGLAMTDQKSSFSFVVFSSDQAIFFIESVR